MVDGKNMASRRGDMMRFRKEMLFPRCSLIETCKYEKSGTCLDDTEAKRSCGRRILHDKYKR